MTTTIFDRLEADKVRTLKYIIINKGNCSTLYCNSCPIITGTCRVTIGENTKFNTARYRLAVNKLTEMVGKEGLVELLI